MDTAKAQQGGNLVNPLLWRPTRVWFVVPELETTVEMTLVTEESGLLEQWKNEIRELISLALRNDQFAEAVETALGESKCATRNPLNDAGSYQECFYRTDLTVALAVNVEGVRKVPKSIQVFGHNGTRSVKKALARITLDQTTGEVMVQYQRYDSNGDRIKKE